VFDTDEHGKANTTIKSLAKMKPAFKKDSTVTAGNASGINDGAALFVLAGADVAAKASFPPVARIVSYVVAGYRTRSWVKARCRRRNWLSKRPG
jgi:acetyl-CoA C-acetyltransferase